MSERMRVAIRTDASVDIGTGHVMRCLTLADALKASGANVHFLTRGGAAGLADLIRQSGHMLTELPASTDSIFVREESGLTHAGWLPVTWQRDADESKGILESLGSFDCLIVDHYALDARWERALRAHAPCIMVIDDLADRAHDCDILLDHNYVADLENRYKELVPSGCQKLIGPKYALLRPAFAEARTNLRHRDGTIRRILVCFGGADPDNETAKALRAIVALERTDIAVDVVIGFANPHGNNIAKLCTDLPNATLHRQTGGIAALITSADLAIGAGGGMSWERCCLGLPTITVAIADNQLGAMEKLADTGAAIYLGRSRDVAAPEYAAAIIALAKSPPLVRVLSAHAAAICDGRGAYKVVSALSKNREKIRIRTVKASDSQRLLDWRNHPSARQNSLDQSIIDPATHRTWFKESLNNPNSIMLIGVANEVPVGVVRFAICGGSALTSLNLAPDAQGQGVGPRLLAAGIEWLQLARPEISNLKADIRPNNQPSVRTFARCGFVLDRLCYQLSLSQKTGSSP